jgi:beta-phosphoglucomutase-like phosphatase (HAD superfamily)
MKAGIGVIFDMDGVIMDKNLYHEKAWKAFCEIHKVHLTDEELRKYVFGRIAKDTVDYIFKKNHSQEAVDRYVNEKEEVYREMYSANIKLVDGLNEFLEELKENEVQAALNSGAYVIAVSTTHRPEEFQNVSGIIQNFRNMNYEKLTSQIITEK